MAETDDEQAMAAAETERFLCSVDQHHYVLVESVLGEAALIAGCIRGCGARIYYAMAVDVHGRLRTHEDLNLTFHAA